MNTNKRATLPFLAPMLLSSLSINAALAAPSATISGLVEVEAGFADNFDSTKASDVALATVELGYDAQINDQVSAHILLLHEDDDTEPMEVDEGTITLNLSDNLSITAGRMYVPFGNYESNMVSDPLTLEIGETREAAIQIGYDTGSLYASLYAFNGDTIEATTAAQGDDTIEHFGASFGYALKSSGFNLDTGVDYISSVGDSDNLSAALPDALPGPADGIPDPIVSYVSGISLHANFSTNSLSVLFEYLKTDQFDATEIAFNGLGAEISAFNVELGYNLGSGTVAIAYQATEEALALGLPETRMLLSYSKDLYENVGFGLEYAMDDDYSIADGGTGNDGSTITAQLAVSF